VASRRFPPPRLGGEHSRSATAECDRDRLGRSRPVAAHLLGLLDRPPPDRGREFRGLTLTLPGLLRCGVPAEVPDGRGTFEVGERDVLPILNAPTVIGREHPPPRPPSQTMMINSPKG
jgi:hypothetical protein